MTPAEFIAKWKDNKLLGLESPDDLGFGYTVLRIGELPFLTMAIAVANAPKRKYRSAYWLRYDRSALDEIIDPGLARGNQQDFVI